MLSNALIKLDQRWIRKIKWVILKTYQIDVAYYN